MAIIERVKQGGNNVISSSTGKLAIDTTNGEIIVRDQTNVRRQYIGSRLSPTGYGDYISDPGVDVVEELTS